MTPGRSILHVDLDSFYVGCERLRRPELVGLPVVVAGGRESWPGQLRYPGRAVVSAASYESRKFGVSSAMPLAQAFAACSELVAIPVDIAYYREVSKRVFELFLDYTQLIEPGSLDEGYLEVKSALVVHHQTLVEMALEIQQRVQDELGLSCSVGGGTNRTVTKIASGFCKPHGVLIIEPGGEAGFLAPLPVEKLPGVGAKTAEQLHAMAIYTLGELALADEEMLLAKLGRRGGDFWRRAQGIDETPVSLPGQAQSISREETFEVDQTSLASLERYLQRLCADLGAKLRQDGLLAQGVAIKLRDQRFATITRQAKLAQPSAADLSLLELAHRLLGDNFQAGQRIRLLGVTARDLVPAVANAKPSAREALDTAMDSIRAKYGQKAIRRAGMI